MWSAWYTVTGDSDPTIVGAEKQVGDPFLIRIKGRGRHAHNKRETHMIAFHDTEPSHWRPGDPREPSMVTLRVHKARQKYGWTKGGC
jgi:hypothetical protein